jgi:hypothetical protein
MNEPTVALPFDPGSASYKLMGLVGFFASSRPHRADVAKTFFLPGFVCPPATAGSRAFSSLADVPNWRKIYVSDSRRILPELQPDHKSCPAY